MFSQTQCIWGVHAYPNSECLENVPLLNESWVNMLLSIIYWPQHEGLLCMHSDGKHTTIRGEGVNQAYSRLSTTHGHITDCKLDLVVYAEVCVVIFNVDLSSLGRTIYARHFFRSQATDSIPPQVNRKESLRPQTYGRKGTRKIYLYIKTHTFWLSSCNLILVYIFLKRK